ncbi:MAG TPA: TMEM175 family protein [Gemmatimonadaceae bacterium]|nr:TMEM175 family protein [Gemmatimonadaceae bacterium]
MRDGDFHVRGKEISRVEGLSDAVFGFAITLLVISLEVPKSADEVLYAMRGLLAFAATFFLLFMIWRTQFTFFRRYGLEDNRTVFLNAVLMFTVLFFVYPLKFVFSTIVERLLWHTALRGRVQPESFNSRGMLLLTVAFGLGFAAVFGVFSMMYAHAYRLRDHLKLNPVEVYDTEGAMRATRNATVIGVVVAASNAAMVLVGPDNDAIAYATIVAMFGLIFRQVRFRRQRVTGRRAILATMAQAST